jgi:hypothetical protein
MFMHLLGQCTGQLQVVPPLPMLLLMQVALRAAKSHF